MAIDLRLETSLRKKGQTYEQTDMDIYIIGSETLPSSRNILPDQYFIPLY